MSPVETRAWGRAALGLLVCILAGPALATTPTPVTGPDFCTQVSQTFAGTTLKPRNTVFTDYQAYRESKLQARPLTSYQYTYPEPGTQGSPMRVSCKVKTPDHLNAVYGPGTARDRGITCRDINQQTFKDVYANLTPAESARLAIPESKLQFEPDDTTFMGSSYVGAYDFAWFGPEGTLHILAKSLRVDWENVWLSWAPDRLRGAYYCHLVAPEYARRLVLGEAKPAHQTGP